MFRTARGPFRWTAYALAVTAFAAAIPTPLYPEYESRFHFPPGVLGLVFAAYTPGVLLTLFVLAPQADRIGRRKLLYLGLAFVTLGSALFAVAPGVGWLAAARAVCGLGVGATTSVATAAMSDLEPHFDQHHVARVAVAANFGGFAVGVFLSGLMAQFVPDPIRLVYILPVAASVLGFLAVRAVPETAPNLGGGGIRGVQRIAVPAEIRRPFWVSAGGIAACYSIYGLFAALAPSYVRSELRIPGPWVTGGIVALMFGAAAVTQLATSQVRDRRALLLGFPLLFGSLAVLVVFLPFTSWLLLSVVSAALGVAVGLTFMGSVTLVDRVAPEELRGEILAGFYATGYLAVAIPTLGLAVAAGVIGLIDAGVLFGSVLSVVVAILYYQTLRTPTPPGGEGRPRDQPLFRSTVR